MSLYTDSQNLYEETIATDGVDVDYVDPTEGPKIIPDITGHPNEFLKVNSTATNIEWTNLNSGSLNVNRVLLGDGTAGAPSLSFQNEANTDSGIYRDAENSVSISAGGLQRLQVTNANVTVGTTTNNADLIVRGNVATNSFYAGNGAQATPSFSFSTSGGNDTGMYYTFDTLDRLRFSAGGTFALEMSSGQSFFNNRLLANSTGTNTTPAFIFHNDSSTTGYSGQRTNPSTDPRLWAIVNGVQATELTTTNFNIGLNTANNSQMKTLNQNGPSNFNTFTPSYSSFLVPQTAIGTINQSLSGVDFDGTNYVVSIAGTGAGNRLWVSQNLSTWTAINDTQISLGNSQVQFGNSIWCYMNRNSGQRQLWTSTAPASTWTQIGSDAPWTTNRQCNRIKFINGQFIILCNTSFIRFSSNGLNWTEYSINATSYNLNDITYSPELQRYVITTTGTVFLYFSGNTITNTSVFTAVSGMEQANCIAYSPKYSMFLVHGNTNNQRYYISKDGINWTFYTNPVTVTNTNNTIWINDFGGFFLDMQFNNNNLAISRDGLSFQLVPNNISLNSVNCLYNSTNKVLLIVGSSGSWGSFRNLLTDLNNYIDTDAIYNNFNSNTRFIDNIEYKDQKIITATGNNHFTTSTFTRSVVNFDTSTSNANILLEGSLFNNRIGTKFKICKFINSSNNVRIHGYDGCRIITPFGVVNNFNSQSSPQTYTIIPSSYFGSFDLTRVSDDTTGDWLVDNVNIYDTSGVEYKLDDFRIGNNLLTDGKLSVQNVGSMSAGSPAIYFGVDSDTGFYSSAANTIDITSGGINKVSIGSNFTIGNVSNSSNLDLYGRETIRQIRVDTMTAKNADFTTSNIESSAITIDASTAVVTMTISNQMPTGTILYINKLDSTNALRITTDTGEVFNGLARTNYVWQTNRGMAILRKFNSTSWQGVYILE